MELTQKFLDSITYEWVDYVYPHSNYTIEQQYEYTLNNYSRIKEIYIESLNTFLNLDNIHHMFIKSYTDFKRCNNFYINEQLHQNLQNINSTQFSIECPKTT